MERYKDSGLSAKERGLDLLKRMDIREKVGQINQRLYGFHTYERIRGEIRITEDFKKEVISFGGLGILYGLYRADPWSGKNFENGIRGEDAVQVYNQMQEYVIQHSRFGIPMLLSTECPHGHQALGGYLLPVNLAMAAAFHPKLIEAAYRICGKQMKELGVGLALISLLDILRDPRWGRSEECFGEDPYLASILSKAIVNAVQSEGVAVVAKHFAAQGETTGGVNASSARIGERELREIHLPAAKACVNMGVKGIMAAYNDIDGVPCHGNAWLLKDLLRDEMGFSGIVMADGTAIDRLNILTGDTVKSGALALSAGVDISLWDEGFSHLETAVKQGDVSETYLDEAVLRVLELKFEQGLFEQPYLEVKQETFHYHQREENLQIARESAVLLKNDGKILPLSLEQPINLAVIGPNIFDIYSQMGDYTPPLLPEEGITIAQGIQDVIHEKASPINLKLYRGCEFEQENEELLQEALEGIRECHMVILALGGSSSRFCHTEYHENGAAIVKDGSNFDCGEGVDVSEISLPMAQQKLASAIFQRGKPVVSLIVAGRPYEIREIAGCSSALFYSFYPGPKGGRAIAELLFGKAVPSGRLPVSLPRKAGQIPAYYNHHISYQAMKYKDEAEGPLYPFGAGIGYGSIEYSNFTMDDDTFCPCKEISIENIRKKGLSIHFCMENKAGHPAFGVPMLYTSRRQGNTVPRKMELKAFEKRKLQPLERCQAKMSLKEDAFTFLDIAMEETIGPGEVYICIKDGTEVLAEMLLKLVK